MMTSSGSLSSQRLSNLEEETPLLQADCDHVHERYNTFSPSEVSAHLDSREFESEMERDAKETPLDWSQFSVVLFLQLAEPLTSQVIYPFAPQLIRELGITNGDETKVGYYVGMMQSIFFASEGITVLHWSRVSDRMGRKPIILAGLLGLSLSMYCFGLSRTFFGFVTSRCLAGALNGNAGVIKSMMGEMTDETNVARAFAWGPLAWSTGGTIGPFIGGAFSHPAERFPVLFGNNKFLRTYPYFLPCAIPATFTLVCWIITYVFLRETNPRNIPFPVLFTSKKPLPPGTPENEPPLLLQASPAPSPLRKLFTSRTVLASSCYALLSLLDITFRALQPVFYATPSTLGGLGFAPHHIGLWLALLGAGNGIFQITLFPRMCKSWGVRTVFLVGVASAVPIFALFPLMSVCIALREANLGADPELPNSALLSLLVLLPNLILLAQLGLTLVLWAGYGASFVYITSSAPRSSLGAVNGLSQTMVSFMRCIGPAFASSLFSECLRWQYSEGLGLLWGWSVYWLMIIVAGVTFCVGRKLPNSPWRREEVEAEAMGDI